MLYFNVLWNTARWERCNMVIDSGALWDLCEVGDEGGFLSWKLIEFYLDETFLKTVG